jgi:hypothetical protein
MNLAEHARQLQAAQKDIPQMMLVFGDAFTGKTSLVAQLARKYKILWIDTDNGYDSIFEALPAEFWGNIELITLRDTDSQAVAAKTIWTLLRSTGPALIDNKTGLILPPTSKVENVTKVNLPAMDTEWVIVVDSLTKLSDSSMQNYLGGPANMDFKKKEFTHYDKQGLYLRNIFNACQRLNCHVVFITHEEELEQEDGSKKLTPVCGTRNFSTQIGRYFSHCIHTSIKNKKHVVNSNTVGELRSISGSRANVDVKTTEDFINIFKRDFSKVPKGISVTAEEDVKSKAQEIAEQEAEVSEVVEEETPTATKPLTLAEKVAATRMAAKAIKK